MAFLRVLFVSVLILLILAAGFLLWFGFSFAGQPFYGGMAAAVALLLAILVVLRAGNYFSVRHFFISIGLLIMICALAVGGHKWHRNYVNRVPTVTDPEVDISIYIPFRPHSAIVRLHEPSTLQLRDGLPVMDGATALYPVYASFAAAVYPEKEYHTQGRGDVQ